MKSYSNQYLQLQWWLIVNSLSIINYQLLLELSHICIFIQNPWGNITWYHLCIFLFYPIIIISKANQYFFNEMVWVMSQFLLPTMMWLINFSWKVHIHHFSIIILSPSQNGHHFADNILKCIFFIWTFMTMKNIWQWKHIYYHELQQTIFKRHITNH